MTVAQLAERRPVEANVAGSNPVSHPFLEISPSGDIYENKVRDLNRPD